MLAYKTERIGHAVLAHHDLCSWAAKVRLQLGNNRAVTHRMQYILIGLFGKAYRIARVSVVSEVSEVALVLLLSLHATGRTELLGLQLPASGMTNHPYPADPASHVRLCKQCMRQSIQHESASGAGLWML